MSDCCRIYGPRLHTGADSPTFRAILRRLREIDMSTSPSVRAKFRCLEVTKRYSHTVTPSAHNGQMPEHDAFTYRVKLAPVMSKSKAGGYDQDHENKAFYDATPGGEIELTGLAERAAAAFRPGQAYYIDFTEADG